MYAGFITALDNSFGGKPPFNQLDERQLADIGVDRFGRFVDPDDHRHEQPRSAERAARNLVILAFALLQG